MVKEITRAETVGKPLSATPQTHMTKMVNLITKKRNNNQSGKSKKVFGGKFNKMNKAGKGRPAKGGKGKGKSRK